MEITNSFLLNGEHPLDRAARLLGGRPEMARQLHVTVGAIGNWKTRSGGVPIDKCVRIEVLSRGAVTRKDLRPKDWNSYWPELAQQQGESTNA